jgi:hypothetical protein
VDFFPPPSLFSLLSSKLMIGQPNFKVVLSFSFSFNCDPCSFNWYLFVLDFFFNLIHFYLVLFHFYIKYFFWFMFLLWFSSFVHYFNFVPEHFISFIFLSNFGHHSFNCPSFILFLVFFSILSLDIWFHLVFLSNFGLHSFNYFFSFFLISLFNFVHQHFISFIFYSILILLLLIAFIFYFFILWSYPRLQVSQLNTGCFYFCFQFHPLTLGYWVLSLFIFLMIFLSMRLS